MVPPRLNAVAWISFVSAFVCAVIILVDVRRHPQKMAVMAWVWPITALYAGLLAYWRLGRMPPQKATKYKSGSTPEKPFWAVVAVGATHCGAGCTLGDIVAEITIFFAGLTVAGSTLGAEYVVTTRWRSAWDRVPVFRDRTDARAFVRSGPPLRQIHYR